MNTETIISFAKVDPNAIIPSKTEENVGYDIYACFDENYMVIAPNTTKLIPTGIASACDNNYYFQIEERGSTGSRGMKKSAGVIDSGYRGTWFIAITNCNNKPIVITKEKDISNLENDYIVYPYTKAIAQAVLLPVPKTKVVEMSYDELKNIKSNRGTGILGSSGK